MDNSGQYKPISMCGVQKCHSVTLALRDTLLSMYTCWVPFLTLPAAPQEKQDQAQPGGYSSPTALAVNRKLSLTSITL